MSCLKDHKIWQQCLSILSLTQDDFFKIKYLLVHEFKEILESFCRDGALANFKVGYWIIVHVIHTHFIRDSETTLKIWKAKYVKIESRSINTILY